MESLIVLTVIFLTVTGLLYFILHTTTTSDPRRQQVKALGFDLASDGKGSYQLRSNSDLWYTSRDIDFLVAEAIRLSADPLWGKYVRKGRPGKGSSFCLNIKDAVRQKQRINSKDLWRIGGRTGVHTEHCVNEAVLTCNSDFDWCVCPDGPEERRFPNS